ncbi:MAG: tetratricopeptide repeat protein [Chloroflexi bacterium]|nr:tetratricopeptide repeat protein [Chloroflexota bacterium]
MAVFQQSEDRLRQRRLKAEQAIQLAMKSRWQEAVEVNRQILAQFPKDVDAYNRLGKALMELGRYDEARDAYSRALKLDPVNTIASKNLQRLAKLAQEGAAAPPPTPVDPRLFIEESGRTVVTTLVDVAKPEVVAKLGAGDRLVLQPSKTQVMVHDESGQQIGRLEPKLGQRLLKLLDMGNRYSAAVTSAEDNAVRVIIRETFRDPRMGSRPSFPTTPAPEAFRGYVKAGVLKYDIEELEDDDEAGETEEVEVEGEGIVEPELGLEEPIADDTDIAGEQV